MKLELLAPAKNLDYGREAVNHGADALYIGAPAYGARAAATNTLDDIEQLVRYSHLYGAKVFVTVNTLLFDNEVEGAVKLIHQLYNIGVDAILIQDLGLLQCDLPPIELHASTQCHNASIERVKLIESIGFKRVVLARETSLDQMRTLRQQTHIDLEAFIHGALCVSYSGQCYLSQYLNGRSGNRGSCSQPCRSAYDLCTADGRTLLKDKHLLSLRDLNASQQLASMIDAGITSFKIEGRLKDLPYVKNITAYYRQLLDQLANQHEKASVGSCTFRFTPDPERTFNRGYTDYFLRERQPMASLHTQKSLGKVLGKVTRKSGAIITVDSREPLAPGDGLCYFDSRRQLQGFLVNQVQGNTLVPNQMPADIAVGTLLYRNHDHLFERVLLGPSAQRKIGLQLQLTLEDNHLQLRLIDEEGLQYAVSLAADTMPQADHPDHNHLAIEKQLAKLGDTPYQATCVDDLTEGQRFIPASTLNALRRDAVASHTERRINHHRPLPCPLEAHPVAPAAPATVDYRANITNRQAEAFYLQHGYQVLEHGLDETHDYAHKALMTTKYCLRYELGCCLKGKDKLAAGSKENTPGGRRAPQPQADIRPTDTLYLCNNGQRLLLTFDCRNCQMLVQTAG